MTTRQLPSAAISYETRGADAGTFVVLLRYVQRQFGWVASNQANGNVVANGVKPRRIVALSADGIAPHIDVPRISRDRARINRVMTIR
jgi:hypothetical protein